jgi:hypothetical protein
MADASLEVNPPTDVGFHCALSSLVHRNPRWDRPTAPLQPDTQLAQARGETDREKHCGKNRADRSLDFNDTHHVTLATTADATGFAAGDLMPFCPECAKREFAPEARASLSPTFARVGSESQSADCRITRRG